MARPKKRSPAGEAAAPAARPTNVEAGPGRPWTERMLKPGTQIAAGVGIVEALAGCRSCPHYDLENKITT